jgi:hypothetical protein
VLEGPPSGGTLITITGSNFAVGAVFTLDGVALSGLTRIDAFTYSGFTPAGSPGFADLQVVNPDLQSATLLNAFEYKAMTPTQTPLPSSTEAPDNGHGIEEHGVSPNPNSGAGFVAFKLKGRSDAIELKVFTKSMTCLGSSRLGAQSGGWSKIPLPAELLIQPNGLYYYQVKTFRGGVANKEPGIGSLMLIR